MTVYIAFCGLSLAAYALSSFFTEDNRKRNRFFCAVFFLGVFLLLSLRHPSMGVDLGYDRYFGYLPSFDDLSAMSWGEILTLESWQNYEYGYILFNKFVGMFTASWQVFLAVCAFVSLLPIFLVFYACSEDHVLSSAIYFGLPSFCLLYSGLRQNIAIAIVCGALYFLMKKKPLPFLLLILFAVWFHETSIVFLLAYPLYHLRLTRAMRVASVALLPIVFVLRTPLMTLFFRLLGREDAPENTGAVMLLLVFTAVYVVAFLLAGESEEENGLLNIFFVACLIQCFSGIYNTAIRLGYYFMLALPLLLPRVLANSEKGLDRTIARWGLIAVFLVVGLYFIYSTDWAISYPYHFFFETV